MTTRNRAFRRHQIYRHMWRRLKEDRNQHYDDLTCPCWSDLRAMAKFKEQPKLYSPMSAILRAAEGPTMQERRAATGNLRAVVACIETDF